MPFRKGPGSGVPKMRTPITGVAGCCARAANGHAPAAPPSSVMKWRRPMKAVIWSLQLEG